ncbi:DUF4105 domain-containing protein [Colwellia sp. MB02u-6]|uniref:lipoprotein N-acyltransferase Lnb domain-containing protein n=1 Tax=Colwellia sp. MB02u-6 TaxID=2759824 RepID=UPI0015F7850A|nr:DUF4105 domain-containing protein [Colwellia sp. MB02u-6]MBA6327390.1 DUF4105 domain-containing protein [Colwellia sp. MB02u-6]
MVEQSKKLVLFEHPIWQAILHVKNGQPINSNYERYLSANNFSVEKEMALTLELILNDKQSECNYPARINFLQEFLDFNETLDLSHCDSYQEYLHKVPIADIYLIYASENVKNASSMLGHIMLRMDGINDKGLNVSHGITFFTELKGFNVPKILYDSLVTGKKGIFQIAPYSDFVNNYLNIELRNIWEYKLSLSDIQKQLIRDITWELGSTDLSYFFHTYNCATVTQLLIASSVPETIPTLQSWLTPLDVVHFVEENNLVEKTNLIPSEEWELRALIDNLPQEVITKAIQSVHSANIDLKTISSERDKLLTIAFYKAYNKFSVRKNLINNDVYERNNIKIEQLTTKSPNFQLEVSDYKMPTAASPDGQVAVGWRSENKKDWLSINLFPVASHQGDNKKHVFGETTLTLASLDILYNPESNNIKLDNFIVYSMHSMIPFDNTLKGYSTGFRFGLERHNDVKLTGKLNAFIEGKLGFTYEFNQDIGAYFETALGIGSDSNSTYLYTTPQLGAYVYLIGGIKLHVQNSISFNKQKSDLVLNTSSLFLDWQIKRDLYLSADYIKYWNSIKSTKSYGMRLRYRF